MLLLFLAKAGKALAQGSILQAGVQRRFVATIIFMKILVAVHRVSF
jgi:hypothetical protein